MHVVTIGGSDAGVHLLRTMGDTFALTRTPHTARAGPRRHRGAGYIGLEMAQAFSARGLHVTPNRATTRNYPHRRRRHPTPPPSERLRLTTGIGR
jgi:hypothetical protein